MRNAHFVRAQLLLFRFVWRGQGKRLTPYRIARFRCIYSLSDINNPMTEYSHRFINIVCVHVFKYHFIIAICSFDCAFFCRVGMSVCAFVYWVNMPVSLFGLYSAKPPFSLSHSLSFTVSVFQHGILRETKGEKTSKSSCNQLVII